MLIEHGQAVGELLVERYLLRELSDDEREAFEEHFFSCHECSTDVILGSIFFDTGRASGVIDERRSAAIECLRRWLASLTRALAHLSGDDPS